MCGSTFHHLSTEHHTAFPSGLVFVVVFSVSKGPTLIFHSRRRQIRETLTHRADAFNLILDDVSITHLVFGKEFTNAIEQKQVAQQEAERQTYIVAKAEQEKKAAIIRAEGEAQAAQVISRALEESGSGLIEVRRIDAAKEVAEKLTASRAVTYLPSGGDAGNNMLLGVNTN